MQHLQNHLIGVDQGSVLLFSDFESGGEMWNGTGPRVATQWVAFSQSFKTPPVVTVGLAMWDIDHAANQRGDLSADKIEMDGFDLVFKTWGDTRVARLRASWLAIGALPHHDDWDLE